MFDKENKEKAKSDQFELNLRNKFATLSTKELKQIVGRDADQYTSAALEIAHEELAKKASQNSHKIDMKESEKSIAQELHDLGDEQPQGSHSKSRSHKKGREYSCPNCSNNLFLNKVPQTMTCPFCSKKVIIHKNCQVKQTKTETKITKSESEKSDPKINIILTGCCIFIVFFFLVMVIIANKEARGFWIFLMAILTLTMLFCWLRDQRDKKREAKLHEREKRGLEIDGHKTTLYSRRKTMQEKFVGGLGEHYCSKECYGRGGATITQHLLQNWNGDCSVCRTPISLRIGGQASMVCWKPGVFLFHCGSPDCVKAVKSHVQASTMCAVCGNSV